MGLYADGITALRNAKESVVLAGADHDYGDGLDIHRSVKHFFI